MTSGNNDIDDKSPYRFGDLIDMAAFIRLMDSFFRATGIPNGVVDASGKLLSLSASDNACAKFHRTHPACEEHCRDSNMLIMHNLREGCVSGGLCQNGLMDYATPVVIEGRQLATLFLGQVLHEPADMDFFRAQAARYGFDERAYLQSISVIPVVEKKHLQDLMAVMVELAQMLAISGLTRLRQTALEHDLSAHSERAIKLEDILDFSPIAFAWSEDDNRLEYLNRQFTRLFGYTIEDLPDLQTWYRLAYPDKRLRKTVLRPWSEAVAMARLNNTQPPELESDIACKNGTVCRVVIRVAWIGQRRMVSFTDITDRWKSEQRMRVHDAMLEMVAKGAHLPDILNTIVRQVELADPSSKCRILLPDAQLAQDAGLQSCWSEPIISSRGKVLGTFAIYHAEPKSPLPEDIERITFAANLAAIAIENRSAHEELERRAYTDYLTGLANRRHFLELAESELARTTRYVRPLSLLMLDIDRFKLVNDTYGHKVGDLVLQRLSELCLATLRDIDIIGRIGGEEFAVLLPETGSEQAMQAAERLCAAIASAHVTLGSGLPLRFTASLGVTTLRESDTNIDVLLNQADQALYRAKNEGRNCVRMYPAESAGQ